MEGFFDFFTTPLSYEFMQRGMLAAAFVGILCSVLGCYVVLRGMAFLGDAVAHAILPGVAVAYLLKADLLVGALVAGVVVSLVIGLFSSHGRVKEDTAIGIVFAGALALGVALMSTVRSFSVDLTHVLFGNVLGVGARDLWIVGGLGLLVLIVVFVLYKELLVVSFDPILAATLRFPVSALRNVLLILLALTVVASLQTVGVGLAAAMLVTPAATAQLLTKRLPTMMLVSALIGAASGVFGLYISYYANIASGASIVLFCTACFVIAYLFAPGTGLLMRRRRARAGVS